MADSLQSLPFRQYLVTLIMCLTTVNYGETVGWMAPVLPLLRSTTNPVIGATPLTDDEIALAGALVYAGSLIGCFIWSGVANRLGRKKTNTLNTMTYVIANSLLCFTNSVNTLYMARLIGGLANAGALINVSMYIAEISTALLKDRLMTFPLMLCCLGTMYVFAFGWLLPFHVFNYVNLFIALVSMTCSFYLPESPVHFLKYDQITKAKRSLIWLRHYEGSNDKHKAQLDVELNILEDSFLNKDSPTPWQDLLIPSTRKALIISIGLIMTQQFSLISVISVYGLSLIQTAQLPTSLLPPHLSFVIFALMHIPGGVGSLFFVKKFNRRFVLITTNISVALCHFFIGLFYYLQSIQYQYLSYLSLVPLIFLSIFLVTWLLSQPVYFIIFGELLPAETRNVGIGVIIIVQMIMMFSLVRLYPLIVRNLGIFTLFWIFSSFLFVAVILIYFFVPETRNKSFKEIVTKLSSDKVHPTVRTYHSGEKQLIEQSNEKSLH